MSKSKIDKMRMRFVAAAIAAILGLSAGPVSAASVTWDIVPGTVGVGDGTITGGTGTWDTTAGNWTTDGGANNVAWVNENNDTAVFGGTAGTVTLGEGVTAGGLVFYTNNYILSGANTLTLGGVTPTVTTANGVTATVGNNTAAVLDGAAGLTKRGVGTLTLNGSAVNTFTGGLNVNGGTLALNFANIADADPANMVNSGNALTIGGSGILSITGKSTGTTSQTLGDVTVSSGGGRILGNKNGGTALNINLGTLTATASGGSLRVGAGGTTANAPVITTTTDKNAQGIYGGRVVFFNGTAGTGYDWATSTGDGPYTIGAYSGYSALNLAGGTDTNNSLITASETLTDNLTTNSLKFAPTVASQVLDLGGKTLTLSSGGLLITGTVSKPQIYNGNLTAGDGTGPADLVIHQYNTYSATGKNIDNNTTISAAITDNGGNPVTLVKAGTGTLLLRGANKFTGGIVVNDGGTLAWRGNGTAAVNNNSFTFNANTLVLCGNPATTSGGITINNGSVISFGNNTQTFTVNGPVTGEGAGITLVQDGLGGTYLNFNSTANTFNGPIRFNFGNTGRLSVNSLADAASLGSGDITFVAGNQTFNYGGSSGSPSAALTLNNRRFEMVNPSAATINNNSSQAFTINTDLLSTGTGTRTLTLGGTGAGISTFAGKITNGTITTLNITKAGSGTWVLSGANTYNGVTTLTAGTLSIGASDNIGDGSATNGLVFNAGTLQITGTALTKMSDLTNGGTRPITYTGGKLVGLNIADASNTFTVDQVLNQTTGGFTKSGAGTVVLDQTNTYTGATTISAGKLVLGQGGSLAATAVSVTGTATYGMAYTSSGNDIAGGKSLSLADGTTLDMQDNNTNTLTFSATGTGALNGASLYFDLGAAGASDVLVLEGAATMTNTNTFYFDVLGTLATGDHAYTLITAASGLDGGTEPFVIGTTLPGYTLALDRQATAVYLNVALDIVPGDTNDDKIVDAADFITLKQNFGTNVGDAGASAGDFTGTGGDVDWDDLNVLTSNMGTGGGAPLGGLGPAVTPEPATLFILMAAGLPALLKRRRSRS